MEHERATMAVYRVVGISEGEVEFRLHSDARSISLLKKEGRTREVKEVRVRKSPDSLRKAKARKVVVDPLGNVLPARD
jgi:hypothetical protein